METYCQLEKLKESIKSDFGDLEERCSEAQNKIQCLEKENSAAKELTNQLQNKNASLKEYLAKLQKDLAYKDEKLAYKDEKLAYNDEKLAYKDEKLAYKDEKLKRKTEELQRKENWWSRYRDTSERQFKAMKYHGIFPSHILEKFVNRDIDEQMKDVPENCSSLKENESSKKHRNLTTLKSKKKIWYNRVSNTRSSAEEKKEGNSHGDQMHVCRADKSKNNFDENLFSDPNESTKLYQNSPEQDQGGRVSVSDKLSGRPKILVPDTEDAHCSLQHEDEKVSAVNEVSVHPVILVPDTDEEDVYPEEAYDAWHCSLGAPSAASTYENVNNCTKQTTLDAKLLRVEENKAIERDNSVGKRKRESSDEQDALTWPSASKHPIQDKEIIAEDEQTFLAKQLHLLQKMPATVAAGIARQQPVESGKPRPGGAASEAVLANFFNSLLNKKSGTGSPVGQGGTAVRSDAAAELDRINRAKKMVAQGNPTNDSTESS